MELLKISFKGGGYIIVDNKTDYETQSAMEDFESVSKPTKTEIKDFKEHMAFMKTGQKYVDLIEDHVEGRPPVTERFRYDTNDILNLMAFLMKKREPVKKRPLGVEVCSKEEFKAALERKPFQVLMEGQMRRNKIYDVIAKAPINELRQLAREMALEIETYLPYGLKKFTPPESATTDLQYRSVIKVNKLVEQLKVHIPIVQQWYMPSQVIMAAVSSSRTSNQIANLLIHDYGAITHEYQLRNIEKMVSLVLSIAGMVNEPSKVKVDGLVTSERRWKLVTGVYVNEHQLWDEFRARMGT